jgi:GNAT superfamily N-acetyltransferase
MKYQDIVDEKYEALFKGKVPFNKKILYKLISYFDGLIDDNLLDDFVNKLVSEENLLNMREGSKFMSVSSKDIATKVAFWEIEKVLSTLDKLGVTKEPLEELVRYSIDELNGSNVIDRMVRYLILNHNQLFKYYSEMNDLDDGDIEVKVGLLYGDIPVSSCALALSESYFDDDNDSIIFDDLLTRKDLRGLKIGERLLKEIFKEMVSKYPERDLVAFRLLAKNIDGQRFYTRLGGELFDLDTGQVLDESLLDAFSEGDIGVRFTKEVIKKMAGEEIVPTTMEDEIKRVSSK